MNDMGRVSSRQALLTRGPSRRSGLLPPYYRIGEIYFDDVEQMQASLASEEGQAVTADFQNFATGGVTIFISEIDS
jgi:uncharacterized protein (TIGR02118 family)